MQGTNLARRAAQLNQSAGGAAAAAAAAGGQQQQPQTNQPQFVRSSGTPPVPINLPPQIAQLPLPMQQQVLNILKQQAIARDNPAVVAAITMAQQQVQQRVQQPQPEQSQQPQPQPQQPHSQPQPPQQPHSQPQPPQQPQPQQPSLQRQQARQPPQSQQGSPLPQPQPQPGPGSNVGTPKFVHSPQSAPVRGTPQPIRQQMAGVTMPLGGGAQSVPPAQSRIPPVRTDLPVPPAPSAAHLPKMDLPPFQTINYEPPETRLPHPNFWSERDPKTDTLLYEQIIQRDKQHRKDLIKETNGYEPFSIYGFSNKEYLGRLWHNLQYCQDLKSTRMKSITSTSQNVPAASIWGSGYSGYGNGITNKVTQVVPEFKIADRSHIYQNRFQVYQQAMNETHEDLVPVRLEFDQERDRFCLRDTLLWNKNDTLVNIEEFVDDMMKDYRYSPQLRDQFAETVVNSIREQILEYQPNPFQELSQERSGGDDMRIKIKLDIVVGQNQLIDQFEWDISNTENSPEEFAECMCQELSLPGEFMTAIVHSIHEQVHMYHKSLALLGYNFDGSPVEDDDIRSRILPVITLDDVYRTPSESKNYNPNLLQISAAELERLDRDKDRDTRRKRRQGRFNRRGVVQSNGLNNQASSSMGPGVNGAEVSLPDVSDIPRTFRTPVPSTILPGGVDLGPSVGSYDLRTTTEYRQRPPKPVVEEPPCQIVDNIPGQCLLLSINLSPRTRYLINSSRNFNADTQNLSQGQLQDTTNNDNDSSYEQEPLSATEQFPSTNDAVQEDLQD
ncbi:hypothetical protein LQ764DRAFT_234813 [Zygosaccharomyces rouxii]|nr:hypothetical protein LQ764DRAFT_234813 [Zygosaccharomyces rouxii]